MYKRQFVSIPKEVRLSFYYIENIIRLIFIGDYIGRLVLSKNKQEFFKENIIDLLSIISIRIYLKCFKVVKITETVSYTHLDVYKRQTNLKVGEKAKIYLDANSLHVFDKDTTLRVI